ncbi:GNAT family N-acetyltransferase [Fusibacter sp. 3D3]|nr:GNAT family N-acetyltransferase [Fusibacter sp. 3D3]GAU76037.1 hypothetical protein F3D3_0633 [Fusibacter sp. 3D3]
MVAEDCRGNGIGTALIYNLFQVANANKIGFIGLETQSIHLPVIDIEKKE